MWAVEWVVQELQQVKTHTEKHTEEHILPILFVQQWLLNSTLVYNNGSTRSTVGTPIDGWMNE